MLPSKVSESDFRLARTLQSQRRLRDAEAVYLRILSMDRFNLRALEALGRLRLQEKRFSEAAAPLRTLVKRAKNSADAHHLLGFVLTGLGDFPAAVRSYQKAVSLKPDFPEARNNLGYALMQAGRHEEALVQFDRAIALLPVFPDAHHNRGGALVVLGRRHEAVAALHTALEQKPTHLAARSDLANLLADLRHGDEPAEQPQPVTVDVDTLNALGSIYLDREEHELAKRAFQGASLREPASQAARIGLADACRSLGDLAAARRVLDGALGEASRKAEVVVRLANLTFATPDPRLLRELEKISARQLDDQARIEVSFAMGRLQHLSGNWSQAWTTLCRANDAVWQTVRDRRPEERAGEQRSLDALRRHDPRLPGEDMSRPILLFILGPSRSGKTLVESVLSPIPDVHRGMENLLVRNALSLARREAATRGPDGDPDNSDDVRRLFREAFYEGLARRADAPRIFTTTNPGLVRRAAWLAGTLPNTRFLFVTRDPEDTVLSLMLKQFREGHYYSYDREASFQHLEWYRDMISAFTALHPGISRSVRYEDVVESPEIVYRCVEDLCGAGIARPKTPPVVPDDRSCARPYLPLLRDVPAGDAG